jgi:hypothetical protein
MNASLKILLFHVLVVYSSSFSMKSDVHVLVNGLPGPMALETAISCLNRGYKLIPFGFTGNTHHNTKFEVKGMDKLPE